MILCGRPGMLGVTGSQCDALEDLTPSIRVAGIPYCRLVMPCIWIGNQLERYSGFYDCSIICTSSAGNLMGSK